MSEAGNDILIGNQLPPVHEHTDPDVLEGMLNRVGALDFKPYPSGLFPACDLPKELGDATTMNMSWVRDNAHVINALLVSGRIDLARDAGQALLQALGNNLKLMENTIIGNSDNLPPLPVRFDGVTLANDTEPRVQHDSTGYGLWIGSRLINRGVIEPTTQNLTTLGTMVSYLCATEYWKSYDQGHWEEDWRQHASSIGVVIGGLREAEERYGRTHGQDNLRGTMEHWLQHLGEQAMQDILASGHTDRSKDAPDPPFTIPEGVNVPKEVAKALGSFSVQNRICDAAMLFLIEPLNVLTGKQAAKIVSGIETYLKREKGFARYLGDTYWGPDYHLTSERGARTKYAEGATEERNVRALGIYMSKTEAQWPMFDPLMSRYNGKLYMQTGDPEARAKQLDHLNRTLNELTPSEDGRLLLPEAFYHAFNKTTGKNELVPNEHTPLLLAQATLLLALKTFRDTQEAKQSGMIPV